MAEQISNMHHNIILDSINEGVFTVDLNWNLQELNAAAKKITGRNREWARGRKCFDVFQSRLCGEECPIKQTLATGEPVVNRRTFILDSKEQCVPVRVSTAVLHDAEGKIIGGVETFQDLSEVERLCKELKSHYTFDDIVGRSSAMQDIFETLPLIAKSDSTVLIEGESGTGKELFARTLHNRSLRCRGRFVPVNCAALPDTLLESEFFGYEPGAFTDAKRSRSGRFELAHCGTIFLDEISDISPALQVRLLRVLQERSVEPLGSERSKNVDVRVLAATNQDLGKMVEKDQFRKDLYYRIRVVRLKIPPLRERRDDIPLLVNHFINKFNHLQGKDIAGVTDSVMDRLTEYDYPGNVRELENIVERAFVFCRGGLIEMRHLPSELRDPSTSILETEQGMTLREMEKALIVKALRRNSGNRQKTARTLGINVSTLYRKIKKMDIDLAAQ
ncbi:MAG: sigma-54 interaction domain-containing protein [Desulfonatronovibrionaceae bacterium]